MTVDSTARPGRPTVEVLTAQVQAIDAWNRARAAREEAIRATAVTREARLDASRREQALKRQHAAIVAHTEAQLRDTADGLPAVLPRRAVLAHRNPWMLDKISALLHEQDVRVVAAVADGADAAGTAIAEQPDLVLIEDKLATLPGADVVREVRQFSPGTLIAAQAQDSPALNAMIAAGAHAAFTRRIPPADVVHEVILCLEHHPPGFIPRRFM